MDRRKELKEIYKNTKPDMGIFIVKSDLDNKCYIEASGDLKSKMNRTKFTLDLGNFNSKELQKQWKEQNGSNFTIEILEKLEYDDNDTKTDYQEELNILKMICVEKLLSKGIEFYIE